MKVLLLSIFVATVTAQYNPNSNTQALVHLFEWKWNDIAQECEDFLGPKGYGGVQVSPASENLIINEGGYTRPWYERYQPVSYILETRSGNTDEFKSMCDRCNKAGVRIYVDVVFNQMTGGSSNPVGTAGTTFDYSSCNYPGVPYSTLDMNDGNCYTGSGSIESYQDINQVKNCRLLGMCDLNQGTHYVRTQISNYLNTLISYGVAGFRVDAAKHMWPGDLEILFQDYVNDLSTEYFDAGTRPFIYQEVIDQGGEPVTADQYFGIGRVTEFKYGLDLSRSFRGNDLLKYLSNFGEDWGLMDRQYALVFIDNHDNQRGSGGGGDVLTFRDSYDYKMAVGFMLAHPYGYTRVMSSFYFDTDATWEGPPHDSDYNTISPEFDSDGACTNGWVCEHRWRQIYNMVGFRNSAHGTDYNDWWDNGGNQIAFCRGDKGFVAFNKEGYDFDQYLQTCLSEGTYCDIVSGNVENGSCTGKSVTVGSDGTAHISIKTTDSDGFLAIYTGSKI